MNKYMNEWMNDETLNLQFSFQLQRASPLASTWNQERLSEVMGGVPNVFIAA